MYIVVVDSSSSSCKSYLINVNNQVIHSESNSLETIKSTSGFIEHDPESIWRLQLDSILKLINRVSPKEVIGLSITNQRETIVAWRRSNGEPYYNAISWQDMRNKEFIDRYKEHRGLIKDKTGLDLNLYFSASKIQWLLENVKVDTDDLCIGTVDSWLIFKLTGLFLTDVTNASRTLLFNIDKGEWDDELLRIFNIPKSILPEVRASGSNYGTWKYGEYSVDICGVIGDQQAALLTTGLDSILCTYGTGLFLLSNTRNRRIDRKNCFTTIAFKLENSSTYYALECGSYVGGNFISDLYNEGLFEDYELENDEVIDSAYIRTLFNRLFICDDREYLDYKYNFNIEEDRGNKCLKSALNGIALLTYSLINTINLGEDKKLWINGGLTRLNYLNKTVSLVNNKEVLLLDFNNYSCLGAYRLALLTKNLITLDELSLFNTKNIIRYKPYSTINLNFLKNWIYNRKE